MDYGLLITWLGGEERQVEVVGFAGTLLVYIYLSGAKPMCPKTPRALQWSENPGHQASRETRREGERDGKTDREQEMRDGLGRCTRKETSKGQFNANSTPSHRIQISEDHS